MFASKLTTATLAIVLVLAVAAPAAAQGSADAGGNATQSITVTIETAEDGTTVTFEQNGGAYSGADVNVKAVRDASYGGSGSYETDADGQIVLPTPDQDVSARVEVEGDGVRAEGVVMLSAYHGLDSETSVTIEAVANGDASAAGNASGADGSAAATGSSTATVADAEVDTNGDGHVSLGERLSSFIGGLARVELGGIGDAVSDFAIGDNPADADDGARAGVDANASAGIDAGNDSVGVEAGNDSVEAGVSAAGSADTDVSADGEADVSGTAEADTAGGTDTNGSADASGSAAGDVEGSGDAAASADADASGSVDDGGAEAEGSGGLSFDLFR